MSVCENIGAQIVKREPFETLYLERAAVIQSPFWPNIPEDLLAMIFGEYDLTYVDFVAGVLTCRQWKRVIERNQVGERLLRRAGLGSPGEENTWMKVYRRWVYFAKYYILSDVSFSMMWADPNRRGRWPLYDGIDRVKELGRRLLPLAKRGINMYAFAESFVGGPVKTEKAMTDFFRREVIQIMRSEGTNRSQLFEVIAKEINNEVVDEDDMQPPTYIHIVSKCAFYDQLFNLQPFVSFNDNTLQSIHVAFHRVGKDALTDPNIVRLKRSWDNARGNGGLFLREEGDEEEEGSTLKKRKISQLN